VELVLLFSEANHRTQRFYGKVQIILSELETKQDARDTARCFQLRRAHAALPFSGFLLRMKRVELQVSPFGSFPSHSKYQPPSQGSSEYLALAGIDACIFPHVQLFGVN
jgi:hypothetical protein